MHDIIIIGAGVIGALIGREASKYELDILMLEKDNDVGNGTTAANSAIVHSGYDPKPGTLKAKFNVAAVPLFKDLCADLDVEFKRIGSLVVAQAEAELPRLDELKARAEINGVEVKILNKAEVHALEPNLHDHIVGGLFAPTAGIVNPFELTAHAIENAIENGMTLKLNEEVVAIDKVKNGFKVTTKNGEYFSKVVINAAGVFADNIINMVSKADFKITPRKGSYFVLDKLPIPLVNTVLFPLPNIHSKGILVVPTTAGNTLIGPTSEEIMSKVDVGTDYVSLENIRQNANRLLKDIPFHKTIRTFSGLRATPSTGDFVIEHDKYVKGLINVAGIESPGLASAPAIALYVVNELVPDLLVLKAKANFNPKIRPLLRLQHLSTKAIQALVKKDKNFAQLVCNCEKITKAEIIDVLSRVVPVNSVKAMKKRLRAGFGLCQGGFCSAKVIAIMSEYYGVPVDEIAYDDKESYVVKHG
ncbi:MAG: L-2-hydroxyglutarate oxidase LhgO [Tenericutes bacterium ADurb.Bin087]|nr:MAG: L-2-hydroxyglutarate oxidase LhgO [Tenericutes bacterium ADurb.Bin087]